MKFGAEPTQLAAGATLAHTLRAGDRVLKKGRMLAADDLDALAGAGHLEVVVARLEPGDLDEDAAAAAVANALAGESVRAEDATTGRANVVADADGLVTIDAARVHALNARDEAITCATVQPFAPVHRGDMLATIKIIPFAVGRDAVAAAAELGRGAISVKPWCGVRAGLITTRGPHDVERIAAVQRQRIASCGGALVTVRVTDHDTAAVAAAIRELAELDVILVLGAAAVTDTSDVIPAAIRASGGTVVRTGMPVDPGNLLVLGARGTAAIVGVPGCARTPRRSGFDAVLERLCAGIAVTSADVAAMGVGGLHADAPTPNRIIAAIASRRSCSPPAARRAWARTSCSPTSTAARCAPRGRSGARLVGASGRRGDRQRGRCRSHRAHRARHSLRSQRRVRGRHVELIM